MERSKTERNSGKEIGREHGRSSYQHTLDTFINARRARTRIRWSSFGISCVRQAAKQRVKCSSFSDLPSFCLASLLVLRPAPALLRVCHLRMLRVATVEGKTFEIEMLAPAKPRRIAKNRNSEIVENSVSLIILHRHNTM